MATQEFLRKIIWINKVLPAPVRSLIRKNMPIREYEELIWEKNNPFINTDYETSYKGNTDFELGILFDPAQYHRYFQAACIDLKISYKVLDLRKNNWKDEILKSNVAAILVWPHLNSIPLKDMYDERLPLINDILNIPVYPDPKAIYLLDNKRRVTDWLSVNSFKQPGCWCFYDKKEALEFVENASFPIVHKTIRGSVSKGVSILKSKSEARALINLAFGKGIVPNRMDIRNKQWNFIFFQEYLHECDEMRMVRIGDSYFAIKKVRSTSAFHSGSGKMEWAKPDRMFFDMTKEICERGNFRSMNVDYLISKDGRVLVNELHPLFHGPIIEDSPQKGRYKYDKAGDKWDFEAGNFYRNYTTNLRVLDAVNAILKKGVNENVTDWLNYPVFYEIDGREM